MTLWIVAITAAAGLLFWLGGWLMDVGSGTRVWTAGLGSIRDVPLRFPATARNDSAVELQQLAARAGVTLEPGASAEHGPEALRAALNVYVRRQLERPADGIDVLPPDVAEYLDAKRDAFSAVRDHLLERPDVAWEGDIGRGFASPMPNLLGHVQIHRALVIRALDAARRGDPAAWQELHSSWQLARVLWRRPEIASRIIALSCTRTTAAAARKMPAQTVPQWFREMVAVDYVEELIAAQQAESWRIVEHAGEREVVQQLPAPIRAVVAPLSRLETAFAIDSVRRYVTRVASSRACDLDSVPGGTPDELPEIAGAFRRVLRLRAELEATERVLQMRRGQRLGQQSQCSDGEWVVSADGFRFSRDIPVAAPGLNVPLAYRGFSGG